MTDTQLQQALVIVGDKATSTDTLHELLATAESQLSRYAKAQELLDRTGPDGWSHQVYDESLRLGGGQGTNISASEWELMKLFPAKKEALRAEVLETLAEGRDVFGKIKIAIEAELQSRSMSRTGKTHQSAPAPVLSCPNCRTPLPRVRRPKNMRQFLWGGWTCAKCGAELDRRARII